MAEKEKAQTGLEYLLTYGWALVLIATVIAVLVFVAMAPSSMVVFSSNDPAKIVVKGGAFQGDAIEVKLQNITGGKIEISKVSLPESESYSSAECYLNDTSIDSGESIPSAILVWGGGEIYIQCSNVTGNPSGKISIEYTDYAGLQKSVGITASGTGSGTAQPAPTGNPITSCAELQAISSDLGGDYYLANNIDCSETSTWNGGQGFIPIGSASAPFTGSLDGQNHTITGIYINRPGTDRQAIFDSTDYESSIKNLTLSGLNITGNNRIAGLVSYLYGTVENVIMENSTVNGQLLVGGLIAINNNTISNATATNVTINGNHTCGGIVASNDYLLENSHASGTVNCASQTAGMLSGTNYETITNSYSSGTVITNNGAGGLSGKSYGNTYDSYSTAQVTANIANAGGLTAYNSGIISGSYATGNVAGGTQLGGLVGFNVAAIENSYSTGTVSGTTKIGGLVGENDGWIETSYSTGMVTGGTSTGGFAGMNNFGTCTDCFWDTQTSQQATSACEAIGKTTAEMKQQATFTNWDFATIWRISEGTDYPRLQWQ